MPAHVTCVAESVLAALLAGRLPDEFAEGLLRHVEDCSNCSEKLSALMQRDEMFGALRRGQTAVVRPDADEVERLVGRVARNKASSPPAMRAKLAVTAGPHEGREFVFEGHDTFLVGRSARCHFRLDDKYFSRVHFLVEMNPPRCKLVDLASRNGTLVNDVRVSEAMLGPGDAIRAGHTRLRFELVDAAGPATASTLTYNAIPEMTLAHEPKAESADDFALPEIPGYELGKELGRGGMGVVYHARREADGAEVALKTIVPALTASRSMVAKFVREVSILRVLDHPRIVRFLDTGEAGGVLYFAMEYVPGYDLARFLKEHGPLAVKTAVRTALQLLSALEYAHARGFVHRDVKPGNLMLEQRGDGKRGIKVADFGLARAYDASQLSGLTLTGDIGGTVDFMPPEQVANFREVTPAADQFSAAATLYRLLTNQPLYDETTPGHPLMKVLEGEIIPLWERMPELPAELAAIVMRGLACEPADRYGNVTEFRAALMPFGS